MSHNNREDFKDRLADLLEDIFESLKQSSRQIADSCVLPTSKLTITIKPIGDIIDEEIPSITIDQEFLPNKEALDKFFKVEVE